MFHSLLDRKFVSRARVVRRVALIVSLFAVAALPYANAGAWQEKEVRPRKAQPAVKGQANIVNDAEFVPGEVLVRFRTEKAAKTAESVPMPLRAEDGGGVVFERFGGTDIVLGLRVAKVNPARTLEAVAEIASRPDVLYAEPNYIWRAERTPNDPRYVSGEMYGLNRINAPTAWNTTGGSRNVVVGVIDGGVDINHDDLKANIWTNPGEVPGNGLDDDGNGFVDDIHGWDFHNHNNSVFDNEGSDHHGTHVAGTIGAKGDNNIGVTGVNWDVSIISIKVLGPNDGSVSNIIEGYNYARMMRQRGVNLRVLNNSYGGPGKSLAALDAINQLNNAGILFVTAAGNDARDNFSVPQYPANYDAANVIAVASTDSAEGLSDFSNFGARLISIGAPGTGILSTTPNNTYSIFSGTSMASPHVAGAAALICAANPSITTAQLRGVLVFTGDRIPALEGKTTTGRRLNVANAVASALENDTTTPAFPGNFRVTGQNGRNVTLAWTAPGDDGNTGPAAADYDFFFFSQGTQATTLLPSTTVPAPAGTQQSAAVNVPFLNFSGTIELRVYDNMGHRSSAFVNVAIPVNSGSDPYITALSAAPGLSPMTGTSLVTGDDKYVSYDLPFAFPYYGVSRSSLTVSTNGVLYFSTPPRRDNGDADDVPSSVAALQGQAMIAGLWEDIDINVGLRADSGIFVTQPDASRIIFRWQGVTFLSPHVNVNMEIELRSNGMIQMRYGDNPRVFPVVGISGGEPDAYVIPSHTREPVSASVQPISLSSAQTVTFSPRASTVQTISGRVTQGGAGLSGVTVTLSGAQSATAITPATGEFFFGNLHNGAGYTVTPSKPGYTFTPPTIGFATNGLEPLTANFTATLQTDTGVCAQNQLINFGQTISGSLAGDDCVNPFRNARADEYTFNGAAGQQISISMSSINFDTYLFLLKPDGTMLAENDDIAGSLNSRIPPSGFIVLPFAGTYSILASSFSPEARGDYTLTLSKSVHTISGQVTGGGVGLSGVTVSVSGGASATTTTDANGNYSFTGLPSGENYTITPSNTALYSFTPQTLTALQGNQLVDFNGTLLIIISEFRFRGPAGATDEFVELYNQTDQTIDISGWTLVSGGTPLHMVISGSIPARSHYLITGASYSLPAASDGALRVDIPDSAAVALFNNSTNFATGTRLDAAGFSTAASLYIEGGGLSPASGITTDSEHAFVRKLTTGTPQDTDNNSADFVLIATNPLVVGNNAVLGAPGAENRTSPTQHNAAITASLVDPQCPGFGSATSGCARVRTAAGANPTTAQFGTLRIRRKFTNTTAANVTTLRFRVVGITTLGSPGAGSGQADLRLITSSPADFNVTLTDGTVVPVKGTQVETPAAQPNGGGFNSTVITITTATPIAAGASVNVEFTLGVQQEGAFSFFVNVEALTAPPNADALEATNADATKRADSRRGQ